MERLIPQNSTLQENYSFNRFPLLILTYSIGIIALVSKNYKNLAALFLNSYFYNDDTKTHIIEIINQQSVFASKWKTWLPNFPEKGTAYTLVSDYLHSYMREIVNTYLPDDKKYEEFFDIFEYLAGLIYIDIENKGTSIESIRSTIGRFAWTRGTPFKREGLPESIESFIENGLNQGDRWPLLKAGFFNGSVDRFKECREAYESLLKEISKNW